MSPKNDALKKFSPVLMLVFLPLGLGLSAFVLARVFLHPVPPFLHSADLGIVGIVFGATIRDPGAMIFLSVTAIAFIFALTYLRSQQQREIINQVLGDMLR